MREAGLPAMENSARVGKTKMDIIAMRHAHAVATHPGGDRARPLSERGRDEAARMFALLRDRGLEPQSALVSSAQRTRETAAFGEQTFAGMKVQFVDDLYNASAERITEVVASADSGRGTVLLIAHNPGISAYVGGAHILNPADAVLMFDGRSPIHLRAADA